jgi:hypothetical protein
MVSEPPVVTGTVNVTVSPGWNPVAVIDVVPNGATRAGVATIWGDELLTPTEKDSSELPGLAE